MSVSLILVPLAVAAVAAAHVVRSSPDNSNRIICQVRTRMRDETLLAAALRETDAEVTVDGQEIVATWSDVRAGFRRDQDGIWTAHFTGEIDEQRATEIVRAVDAGYGRQVQATVLQRLRERAPAAGLRLESESLVEDAGVRLVFAVEGRPA